MNIIIAGAGEVGTFLAKLFSNENHDIVVIDTDAERLNTIDSHFDVLAVHGSAASVSTLLEAGIKKAQLFIAVTQMEELNLVSSMLGKRLGVAKTIARVDSNEYLLPSNKEMFRSMGIDSVIYPESLAAREVIGLLKQSGTTEIFEFSGGRLSLFVLKLDENAPIINKTMLEAVSYSDELEYRAVAITRDGKTIIPRGSDTFQLNDMVYVITNQSGISKILKYSGKKHIDVRKLMILGGSRIGFRIAKELEKNLNIKLIEVDKEKSIKLSEYFNQTLIINGDGRDLDLLEEEGIRDMDAFVAVTGNSETNILSCLHAKKLGVKKTIAEIENIDYIQLAENIGIDTIINKKFISASHIYGYTLDADVGSVKYLTGTDAEVIEIIAKEGSKITKGKISELNFPKNAIIGGVVRGKTNFIAKGDCQIRPNDKVVVFTLPSALSKVQKLFK